MFNEKVTVSPVTFENVLEYNNSPLLKYNIVYPRYASGDYSSAIRRLNEYYEQSAYDYLAHIKSSMFKSAIKDYNFRIKNCYPYHMFEAMQVFTDTYNHNCIASLYTDRYEYWGGAHGNTARESRTWNLMNGKQLSLNEFFPGNPRYASDLKAEIISQIREQRKNESIFYFEDYAKLVEKTFNPKSFYLTPEALVIYFQQYDIAPYSSGMPQFFIPWGKLNTTPPDCGGKIE